MAVNKVPVLKRCRSLGLEPSYLGYDKKSKRNLQRGNRKVSEYGLQLRVGRRKCGQVDHNLGKKSIELIGEECGDSPKQVQLHRFFPVTYTAEQMRREILEMLKLNMKKYWDA